MHRRAARRLEIDRHLRAAEVRAEVSREDSVNRLAHSLHRGGRVVRDTGLDPGVLLGRIRQTHASAVTCHSCLLSGPRFVGGVSTAREVGGSLRDLSEWKIWAGRTARPLTAAVAMRVTSSAPRSVRCRSGSTSAFFAFPCRTRYARIRSTVYAEGRCQSGEWSADLGLHVSIGAPLAIAAGVSDDGRKRASLADAT